MHQDSTLQMDHNWSAQRTYGFHLRSYLRYSKSEWEVQPKGYGNKLMKRCLVILSMLWLCVCLSSVPAKSSVGYKTTQTFTLTVAASGHNTTLTWTASPTIGVIGYYIYRGITTGGESSTPLNSTPVNATTYIDLAVVAGQKYYYYVTAVASDGITQSGASNEASDTIPTP